MALRQPLLQPPGNLVKKPCENETEIMIPWRPPEAEGGGGGEAAFGPSRPGRSLPGPQIRVAAAEQPFGRLVFVHISAGQTVLCREP